ncbi:MAG TPA: MFS transporter [Herpetosiphonaceae bacterium]
MAQSAVAQPKTASQKMWDFSIIWFGQAVSMFGNALTNFALGVWAYQRTGSVTLFALITLAGVLPSILISPMAGVYVDRWDRRKVLVATDCGAAVLSLLLAGLLWTDQLMIWHIYIMVAIRSVMRAFQLPAYTASTTMLMPKEHLTRANGMIQFGGAAAQIVAPLLAGFLILTIDLQGIVLIDFITFLVAIASLLLVQIPNPASSGSAQKRSVLREAGYGWNYITGRAGLLSMLIFFAIVNFAFGMAQVLFTPLILKFSTTPVLGTIGSLGGAGLLVGSLVLSTTGGPKRRIHGILGLGLFFGFSLLLAGLQASPVLIGIASFTCMFCIPFINGCSQAIWQMKVPAEVQGRVFATRLMISWSCAPLAYVLAGPLSDQVFEPLMANDGALAGSIGAIIGSGPGRGVGLLFVLIGMIAMLTAAGGYLYRPLRRVEQDLPDAIADKKPAEAAPAPATASPQAAAEAAIDEADAAVAAAPAPEAVAAAPAEDATASDTSDEPLPVGTVPAASPAA